MGVIQCASCTAHEIFKFKNQVRPQFFMVVFNRHELFSDKADQPTHTDTQTKIYII